MKDKIHRITLTLLEKEYQIACPPQEQAALIAAAKEVETRMRKTRLQQGVVGAERVAILVALNLCYELQQLQNSQFSNADKELLSDTLAKLDTVLAGGSDTKSE